MINKGNKIKARKGGKVSVSEDVAKNASKIKARTGGVINIVNPTDTVYKTDTVRVPVVKRDTVYLQKPQRPDSKPQKPDSKPIKELPYPKRTQPILEQDNTRVDMSKTKSKAEYNSYKEKNSKTFNDFFPSNINMAGTSMGSYDKPMMKGSGLEMKCGSQLGKYMGGPKMMGGDGKKGFRESFDENRKAGKKEFKYEGKMYHTKTAEDVAKKLNDKDLYKAFESSEASVNSFENVPGSQRLKSRNEIYDSYLNEGLKRENKMNGAKMMGKKSYGK